MQRVQTLILLVLPPGTAIRTILRLGSQRLLVLLWAWETLLPVIGPLPQSSHTFAIVLSFYLPPQAAWAGVLLLRQITNRNFAVYSFQAS
jgi:hypothetical protein